MPPSKSATLTDAELRLMDVLWQIGPSTVQQVLETLPAKPALAYNSVLTTIRILEQKGYVEHKKDGRVRYFTLVPAQLDGVADWLEHYGRFWTERFDGLHRYLRREREAGT